MNQLYTHMVILLSRQEHIFYMTANSIKSYRTQSKSLSKIFSLFLSLIQMCSAFKKALYMSELKTMDLDDFSFFFSFLFLFLLFIIVEGYFIKRSRGTKFDPLSKFQQLNNRFLFQQLFTSYAF